MALDLKHIDDILSHLRDAKAHVNRTPKRPCNGTPTCLCTTCYERDAWMYERNALRTDCDVCYVAWNFILCEWLPTYCDKHAPPPPPVPEPKARSNKAKPNSEFAFTLTMPPGYTPKKPIEECARLIMVYGKTNKPYESANKWAIVLEHTEQGTPHIHGVYSTPSGRRIDNKAFTRYWPLWDTKKRMGLGHQGGYHAPVRHGESYQGYIEKEGVVHRHPPPGAEIPGVQSPGEKCSPLVEEDESDGIE